MGRLWDEMKAQDLFTNDFYKAPLPDVIVFVAHANKIRCEKKRQWSQTASESITSIRNAIVFFLSECIRKRVQDIDSQKQNIGDRPVPSRRTQKGEAIVEAEQDGATASRKSKVLVNLTSVWELYTDPVETGVSVQMLARTRAKNKEAGMSEDNVNYWWRKIDNMYSQRSAMSMSGARFFNIATDASRHSTRDTLISVVFAQENQVGVYAKAQVLKSGGKLLAPDECLLDDDVERLAATRQIERLASYRLMQAISFQLKQLTGGVTLEAFHIPDTDPLSVALKPLTPDFVRVVRRSPESGTATAVCFHHKQTNEDTVADLSQLSLAFTKPLLNLIMDQGPCGTSFAAFLAGDSCNLIHYGF